MIDCHCHLEQKDYDADRDAVIEKCRASGLRAIVTCCANPKDLQPTISLVQKYKNFVFATASVHPEYIKEIKQAELDIYLELLKQNRDKLVGIGEIGLDYDWVKEAEWRQKQREQFAQWIAFARELKKPIVVHARAAFDDAVQVLEQEGARPGQVCMHMFGANQLTKRVIENGWFISLNTIVMRSKKHKKIARDCPLENLLLETDAPWLAPVDAPDWTTLAPLAGRRNDPRAVKIVAQKIAEIKKIPAADVIAATTRNAIKFFSLPV